MTNSIPEKKPARAANVGWLRCHQLRVSSTGWWVSVVVSGALMASS